MKINYTACFVVVIILMVTDLSAQNKVDSTQNIKTTKSESGKIFLGLNMNIMSIENENDGDNTKSSSYSLLLKPGYYLNEHVVLGAKLGYAKAKDKDRYYENNMGVADAGIFIRYEKVWKNIAGFYIDADVTGSFGKLNEKASNNETEYDITGFEIGIAPGAIIRLSNCINLQIGFGRFGYATYKQKNEDID